MKNKESLLKWFRLLIILAKICPYLAVGIDAALLIGKLETNFTYGIKDWVGTFVFYSTIFFIAFVLKLLLLGISEIIKAVIDIAENIEKTGGSGTSRYFTKS